ncbi:MAG: PD40 domain-containing protein [candidate division Zixibacteria bacterium]|nr:PD40 domain-containing protein [candidate division Zixibacteria bacterium]
MTRFTTMVFCMAILIIGLAATGISEEIRYARYPALSPDGNTIAFSYLGDIWTVPAIGGKAVRLTVHPAEDIRPQFSPDGSKIMFTSRRYDNYDVFIIPAKGGEPTQLTVNSATDIGTSWFAGGDSVLFTSRRDGWRDIFKVSVNGGMPIKLTGYPHEQEYNGRMTSDGRYLLYNTGSGMSRWWRRDLRGSRNADIFLLDRNAETFTSRRLTEFAGHDVWPVLNESKNELYFISCRGDWAQVWKTSLDGGEAVVMTAFTDDGAQWLNSNPQGTLLVFEQNFEIWTLNPETETLTRVPIEIESDDIVNPTEQKLFNDRVEYYALSPDGKKIVTVVHGELYLIPAEEPKAGRRITFTTARELYPAWGADSKTVYYGSDRNGNYDIYAVDVTSGEETRLTDHVANDVKPIPSPDGKYLVFLRGLNQLVRHDLETNKETVWIDGMFSDLGVEPTIEYDWSGDSRWLTFTMSGPTYESDIYIVGLEGEALNVSKFHGWNYRPRFSDDGKVLYYSVGTREWQKTYQIDLMPRPVEFFESAIDSLFMEKEEETKDDKKDDSKKAEIKTVEIDFDRIETRRNQAFKLDASSTYPVLTPDGKQYLFVASILGKPEIWSVKTEDDPDLKQITHSGKEKKYLTVTSDGKDILYLEGGKIYRCGIENGKTTALVFTAPLEIDLQANNFQKYIEAWQLLNSYFYDPAFHGADWVLAKNKYQPLFDKVRTDADFEDILLELMGELRASHLDVYVNYSRPNARINTGKLGIELNYHELDRRGVYEIVEVYADSPADRAGIKPGQYIKTIDGVTLSRNVNINSLLAGTIDHRLSVGIAEQVNGAPNEVFVKPISWSGALDLWYKDWVRERRRLVDSLSNGRLAYIHVPAMSQDKLQTFIEELVAVAEDKEGLILDVRDNGGGNIAVHLLGMLERVPYVLRNFRGFPVTSENKMRSKALEKPMTLLINEYAASNSEILAEGFRQLGLGKIIGTPTAGGVIGTASYALIDGTNIRRPSWGAYTLDMEDTDLYPRRPDIYVDNTLDDFINGRDPQLVRAVKELLPELQ